MSGYNVDVPKAKWTLIEWRNPANVKPKENDKCLVVVGDDIHPARFVNGAYFLGNWTRASLVNAWSEWPKPPQS